MWHKMRTGSHLIGWLLYGNLIAVVRAFGCGPGAGCRETIRATHRLLAGAWAVLLRRGKLRVARLVHLCRAAGVDVNVLCRNPEAAFVVAEEYNVDQRYEDVIAVITPHLRDDPQAAKLYGILGLGYLGLGHYSEAIVNLERCATARPGLARDFNYFLYLAYLHGARGNTEAARRAMTAQMVGLGDQGDPGAALAAFLADRLGPYLTPRKLRGTTGVVIGAFQTAVGHAILDPFHFIQLYRGRFDNLILVHPPYCDYSPATRLTAIILDQYVDQIETTDIDTLNFAWQSLGELRHGNVTFLVHHYWSLNRLAYLARTNSLHPMAHGRDYLTVPMKMTAQATRVCHRAGIDLDRPIVVVHAREHGYHGLKGQRYRNMDVRNYIPALRHLVSLGYQVIRVGDATMTSVCKDVPGLIELPTCPDYDPVLDPFFIARCRFMISCQSGPCSYARVFGKPNLVLNAVYHYTLLPEQTELIAFKPYRNAHTGLIMSLDEIFRASAHLFDRTEHFVTAGIDVDDMAPDEILAVTEEMLAWLDDPDQPETPAQMQFRARMEWYAQHPDRSNPLAHPMTDYIGYALPECRVSDSVCQLRPGYLSASPEVADELVGVS